MTAAMWMIALWAVLIPSAALVTGWLQARRDIFLLFVYGQSLIYINVAPILASQDVNSAMQTRYAWVQAWVLALFQLPLVVVYGLVLRRRKRVQPVERTFRVSARRLVILIAACVIHGVAYFVIAAKYGLLYRRLSDQLATIQLSMSLVEFALYRSFIELGPFLVAAQLLLLRAAAPMSPRLRLMAWSGVIVTAALFFGYAIVNTRLVAMVTIAILFGVVSVTTRVRRISLIAVASTLIACVGGLYSIQVVNRVRSAFANGGSIFAVENFIPIGTGGDATPDDQYRWRLNGIDLIAMIADNVESQGPALGSAWVVPFVLSLDPIVRTPFSVDAKRAGFTTAKTWLMLRYAGVAKEDYYSCLLSDAYGNFTVYGFFLSAVIVGVVLAVATAALCWSPAPAALVFALFALTRILPFELGLESLLFGWFKLVPFVLAFLIIYPLRRIPGRSPAAMTPAV